MYNRMNVCLCVYMCVRGVRACVCVRERERETGRLIDRDRQNKTVLLKSQLRIGFIIKFAYFPEVQIRY